MKMNVEIERRSRNLVLNALTKILRPLVRLLLVHDIKYTMLLDELKKVYVEVADEEFKLDNIEQTDSRITLLTGVHRKDVKRIRTEGSNGIPAEPRRLSLTSQLIAQWLRNPEHLDDHGQPKPLPRSISVGGEKSFEGLVAKISKDIRARPVIDEWLNLGLIRIDADDLIHLNMQGFIPNQNLEEKLFFLSMNVHDHLATAVSNTQAKNPPMLERCVYYYNLTNENVHKLHEAAKEAGMQALTAVNRLAMELKASQQDEMTADDKQNHQRINFGLYFHSSNDAIKPEQSKPPSRDDEKS
jgi:hypothetical protein